MNLNNLIQEARVPISYTMQLEVLANDLLDAHPTRCSNIGIKALRGIAAPVAGVGGCLRNLFCLNPKTALYELINGVSLSITSLGSALCCGAAVETNNTIVWSYTTLMYHRIEYVMCPPSWNENLIETWQDCTQGKPGQIKAKPDRYGFVKSVKVIRIRQPYRCLPFSLDRFCQCCTWSHSDTNIGLRDRSFILRSKNIDDEELKCILFRAIGRHDQHAILLLNKSNILKNEIFFKEIINDMIASLASASDENYDMISSWEGARDEKSDLLINLITFLLYNNPHFFTQISEQILQTNLRLEVDKKYAKYVVIWKNKFHDYLNDVRAELLQIRNKNYPEDIINIIWDYAKVKNTMGLYESKERKNLLENEEKAPENQSME